MFTRGRGAAKLTASPVVVSAGPAVKLVRADGSRETTETVPLEGWPARLQELRGEGFDRVHLLTPAGDWHARLGKRGWLLSRGKPSLPAEAGVLPAHDRAKRHALPPDDERVRLLLVATGLFSPQGRLRAQYADKYRQVQHFVELLRPLPIWRRPRVRIVDAGSGKAYLSLALYAYGELAGVDVELLGLDSNPEVVEKAGAIAAELGYERARFETTTIREYLGRVEEDRRPVDLLVSLHACDTATDEAIAAGVRLDAGAIVVAPCCHRELAGQMRADADGWGAVLQHGLLRGRLADILTDSLRASALELMGYRAEAIEFVAVEHTAKNLMIRAVRRRPGPAAERAREAACERYEALADAWGVRPALETLLGERWPLVRT